MPFATDDVRAVRGAFAERLNNERLPFNLTKVQLDEAIAAIDAWIDANIASFNAALPSSASSLTAAQKAELFFLVARRRFGA